MLDFDYAEALHTIRTAIHELWKAHAKSNGERLYIDALATLYTAKEEYDLLSNEDWRTEFWDEIVFAQDIVEARK